MNELPANKKLISPVRILAIIIIFVCTTVAWSILGGSIVVRTEQTGTALRDKVKGLWGSELEQLSPFVEVTYRKEESVKDASGEVKMLMVETTQNVHPLSSELDVEMWAEHRKKGLLWYNLYRVGFSGAYQLPPPPADASRAAVRFDFPSTDAVYDNLQFIVNGKAENPVPDGQSLRVVLAPPYPDVVTLEVKYVSQGTDRWKYAFEKGKVSQVKDFFLKIRTHFGDFDFSEGALSPTAREETSEGWKLEWKYASLLADPRIGIQVPQKLNPGPVASRITFFAPVSLLFFFFMVLMLSLLRGIALHPMHYFFLAAAFFSFHLLFGYLIDRIDLNLAFAVASAVSLFLVISYLRMVAGARFACVEAGISQFLYLVLFSYAFFWEGYTGLSITVGAIITLFVMMQKTAKVDWDEKFS